MDVDRIRQALLDLKAYGVGGHLCDYDINEQDVIDVIDGLRKANDWQTIDTAEPHRVVLVSCEWGVVIADFANGRWWSGFDSYGNDRELECVTHWMPLPSPPTDRRTPEKAE